MFSHFKFAFAVLILGCLAAAPATQPATRPIRVVFVVDASGSMQPAFRGDDYPKVQDEVAAGVAQLPDGQQFAVFIDSADKTIRFPQNGYATANEASKALAVKFITDPKLKATGSGQLDRAVAAACALKPDTLFLVTDGDLRSERPQIPEQLIATAKQASVAVNTSFVFARDGAQPAEQLLFQIATETGGRCLDRKGKAVETMQSPTSRPARTGPSIFQER